ncbi:hypothetical protein L209DRAFT_197935 [Thermothelomyces heterothallicus CBS 203.75]
MGLTETDPDTSQFDQETTQAPESEPDSVDAARPEKFGSNLPTIQWLDRKFDQRIAQVKEANATNVSNVVLAFGESLGKHAQDMHNQMVDMSEKVTNCVNDIANRLRQSVRDLEKHLDSSVNYLTKKVDNDLSDMRAQQKLQNEAILKKIDLDDRGINMRFAGLDKFVTDRIDKSSASMSNIRSDLLRRIDQIMEEQQRVIREAREAREALEQKLRNREESLDPVSIEGLRKYLHNVADSQVPDPQVPGPQDVRAETAHGQQDSRPRNGRTTAATGWNVPPEGLDIGSRENLTRSNYGTGNSRRQPPPPPPRSRGTTSPFDNPSWRSDDIRPRGGQAPGGNDPGGSDDDGDNGDPRRGNRDGDRGNRNTRDRNVRETSYETFGLTSTTNYSFKIKREDLGIFNPDYEDPDGEGKVTEFGKTCYYTDVDCFIENIRANLEDEATAVTVERQIRGIIQNVLEGTAKMLVAR